MKTVTEQLEELHLKVKEAVEYYKKNNKDEEIRLEIFKSFYSRKTSRELQGIPLARENEKSEFEQMDDIFNYIKKGLKNETRDEI